MKSDGAFTTLLQVFGNDGKEALAALKLAQKVQPAGRYFFEELIHLFCPLRFVLTHSLHVCMSRRDLKKMDALFSEHWEDIYDLAALIEDRHIAGVPGKDFLEPVKNISMYMLPALSLILLLLRIYNLLLVPVAHHYFQREP